MLQKILQICFKSFVNSHPGAFVNPTRRFFTPSKPETVFDIIQC